MKNGSVTLFAVVLSVCFVAGGVTGTVLAMIDGPKVIDIPEGTLIVPENGKPYYYFENGIVIANLTLPENYSGTYTVWAQEIPPVHIMIKYTEDVGWKEEYGRLKIEGRPFQIWVDWPVEYYEHMITGMPVIMILDNIEHEGENRLVFQLLWD